MIERSGAVAAVNRLLNVARDGRGGALFIVGEAGLGKTTLLDYAITLAREHFVVGLGRGDAVEAVLPFGLVGQALGQLGGGVLLEPSLGGSADLSAEGRLYAILCGVREAAIRPLLLAFDDLHWSDPDSRTAIHLLCRRLTDLPVALIATTRPWPAGAVESARDLAAQGCATVEHLAPLSPHAATTLLNAQAGKPVPGNVVGRVVALCAGNPLLLEQAAGSLRRGESLVEMGSVVGAGLGGRFVLSRFLDLEKAGQRYVQAASVLGTHFRPVVAAEVSGLSGQEAADILEALFQGGLLKEGAEGWAKFTHALVRQAVYEDLAAPVRAYLHEAAFRALATRGVHPAEVAQHATTANLVGDPEAVAALARAGREALKAGAVGAARQHLEASARLAGETAPAELLLDLGKALIANGASEAAITTYERLLERSCLPEPTRITALRHLGQAAFTAGQADRAADCYESAVRLAQPTHPELAIDALLDYAFHNMVMFHPKAALPIVTRARELAATHQVMQAPAEVAWGFCANRCGDPNGLTTVLTQATQPERAPNAQSSRQHWFWDPVLTYAILAVYTERFTDAERLLTQIIDSERPHEPLVLVHALIHWSGGLCWLGRLAEATAVNDRLDEITDLFPHLGPVASTHRAWVLLEQGQLEQVASWCEQGAAAAGRQDPGWGYVNRMELYIRATLAFRRADTTTACGLFAQLHELYERSVMREPSRLPWLVDAVAAHLACDRDTDAQSVLDGIAPLAEILPTRWPKIVHTVGTALLADHTGNRPAAEAAFTQALALHNEMDIEIPLAKARTLTEYGAFLNRTGQPARARPLLADALRIAETCGAAWHATQARIQWRRAGGRAATGTAGTLTPQETAVAQLAKAGKTNQQIAQQLHLSVKTVETHLAHTYRKLGIHRRWELITRPDLEH